jgi:hypothetical protein
MVNMKAKEYSRIHFYGFPTYQKIAEDAFKAGEKNAIPEDVKKLKKDLAQKTLELKKLWETIEDPEQFAELFAGL